MTTSVNDAVNPQFTLSGPTEAGFTCPMDSLLLIFLLLGGTADRPTINAPSGQAQAMARVRILRGEAIDFAASVNRRSAQAPENSQNIFQIAPIRSTAAIKNTDGRTVELQEFH